MPRSSGASYSRSGGATRNKSTAVAGVGFPKKMMTTLKYCETVPLVSTSGSFATYYFSTNSLFKPNASSGGHQPMYYDQYSALYTKYTVLGSKVKVSFLPSSATVGAVAVGVLINDDLTTAPTTFSGVFEQSLATCKYINFSSSDPTVLTTGWSAKKTHGGSVLANNKLTGNTGNTGPTATSPGEESFYLLMCQSADGVSTNSLVVSVEISFVTMFTELRDVPQS